MVPFHLSFPSFKALEYFSEILKEGKSAGGGKFNKKVENLLRIELNSNVKLTNSCTSALEIAALLLEIGKGDEVILPTYTFPSTANAFLLRGATIKWADSQTTHPNMDLDHAFSLVNNRTRAIVPMYYGGVAIDWEKLKQFTKTNNLSVIEEAAQAWGAFYNNGENRVPLGTIGDAGVISFHSAKNVSAGEGGAIICNRKDWEQNIEIIIEKGTNRSAFQRGEINHYEWVNLGSSYVNSEWNAAYLLAQLEEYPLQFQMRCERWKKLAEGLAFVENYGVELPQIPEFAEHNAHLFYLVFPELEMRKSFQTELMKLGFETATHYQCLHDSKFFNEKYDGEILNNSKRFQNGLLRLPIHHEVDILELVECVNKAFRKI